MYLTIGETKLLVGQYGKGNQEKLELTFEYAFSSHNSYRRFAQVIYSCHDNQIRIKLKSDFKHPQDCIKLSQLILGVEKLITEQNLELLREILKPKSSIQPDEFVTKQKRILKYFK